MSITSVATAPVSNVALASRACGPFAAALLGVAAIAPTASALAPGEDGVRVTVPVSGIGDVAQAVALDPNGNIVLAGTDGGNNSVLVRLMPSGALDLSFGSNGIAIIFKYCLEGTQYRRRRLCS